MIHFYETKDVDEIPWNKYVNGSFARSYLSPLMKEGVEKYIENVHTELAIVGVGNHLIPITINHAEYRNSYVASNYYFVHYLKEWMQKKWGRFGKLHLPFSLVLGSILKVLKVNRVVFVNNWLLPGNPTFQLSKDEISALGHYLAQKFPKHFIMWRNITDQHCETPSVFRAGQFCMLKTRRILMYDPAKKGSFSSKVHYHHRRDLRLAEELGYQITTVQEDEIPRLLELYNQVYIDKHTQFGPRYSRAFLKNVLNEKIFDFVVLKKEKRIDGVIAYLEQGELMQSSFFGYETTHPSSQGLYRLLTVLLLKESEKRERILNDGSGGEQTKKIRGLYPRTEYVGVYYGHLPTVKKLFWQGLEKCLDKFIS